MRQLIHRNTVGEPSECQKLRSNSLLAKISVATLPTIQPNSCHAGLAETVGFEPC
jgi:hypothetical protein